MLNTLSLLCRNHVKIVSRKKRSLKNIKANKLLEIKIFSFKLLKKVVDLCSKLLIKGILLVIALKYCKLICPFPLLTCDFFFCFFRRLVWKNLKAVLKFQQKSCVKVGKNFLVSVGPGLSHEQINRLNESFSFFPYHSGGSVVLVAVNSPGNI